MIRVKQTLTVEDYQAAAAVHYRTYHWTRIQPWLAIVLIGTCGFFFFTSRIKGVPIFGIGYGIFMLIRKNIWIDRLVKSAATAKHFGAEIEIEIDDGFLRTSQAGDESKMHLSSLFGFVRCPTGLLVYPQRNLFYYLKADAFDAPSEIDEVITLLRDHEVRELLT